MAGVPGGNQAWVTLATNDTYALGALVLCHSLRRVSTTRPIAVMITPGVSNSMRELVYEVFDIVKDVDIMDSGDETNLALLDRPDLGVTFTKLNCWRMTDYTKCVFLDADTLVIQNCDELFDREELSAAPDIGWPDCFNSGVFVYRPSEETYQSLVALALTTGSFDGADQGLLNMFFSDWATRDISRHLPFIYNMCASGAYSYLPAFRMFAANVKIVHFIGVEKPWMQICDGQSGEVHPAPGEQHLKRFLQMWWDIFRFRVHPHLTHDMSTDTHQTGLAGTLARISLSGDKPLDQREWEDLQRKHLWEGGHMDYGGRDSFSNIMSKMEESLAGPAPRGSTPPPCPPSRPCLASCPCARRKQALRKAAEKEQREKEQQQ